MRQILTSRLSLSKHLAHNLGNLLLLGKIGVFHNRRNASSRLLLLISKHLILCIYLVFRILACSRRLNASNLFLSLILHLGNLFLIVQLHFSKLFLILKSGVNHTSRGSISTSTLPSIKLRKCSSKIITSILSFISGRLATKSNQIKQLIRNGRSASLQRTFKKSFTSFSHSTRNKTRDGLIRVRNIRALNGRFNTSIRSEERFSRNAETDLVCRLLLEKKKSPSRRRARREERRPLTPRPPSSLLASLVPPTSFFFQSHGDPRDLHSFPTRRSSDLSLQRTFKKSFTSFSHSTRNKTRDGLIRVRNIRALNGRFNTSITHAYSIVIGSKHITLNATGGGFLTASKQFRHGATSKSRSNTASNSTKHKSPHLSGWRQIISLIT